MNAQFEKYIEGLSPELQEKARACKTKEELIQLAAEEDVEIPMEALANVAGGCGSSECPKGGNHDWEAINEDEVKCLKCGKIIDLIDLPSFLSTLLS